MWPCRCRPFECYSETCKQLEKRVPPHQFSLYFTALASFLDSREAEVVVRTLKNIANTGRTVICTIHQPSLDVFCMFDALVLLVKGGNVVYTGSIGEDGTSIVQYFESISEMEKMPSGSNPATWMLDVVGAGTMKSDLFDYGAAYKTSDLAQETRELIDGPLSSHRVDLEGMSKFQGVNSWQTMQVVLKRMNTSYWRNTEYNATRIMVFTVLGLIFGSVYFDLDDSDMSGLQSKWSAVFVTSVYSLAIHAFSCVTQVVVYRSVMIRETSSRMYSPIQFSLALSKYLSARGLLDTVRDQVCRVTVFSGTLRLLCTCS